VSLSFGDGEPALVRIRITNWDEGAAWTGFTSYHPRDLERRLVQLTGWGRADVKRLIRSLKDRKRITFPLPGAADRFAAESLRSFLESLGAAVKVEDAETGGVSGRRQKGENQR
jgi:hypothetical protein